MVIRVIATIVLTAASWAVWYYAPNLLHFLGLDDLDIPARVCAVFLFLSLAEAVLGRLHLA